MRKALVASLSRWANLGTAQGSDIEVLLSQRCHNVTRVEVELVDWPSHRYPIAQRLPFSLGHATHSLVHNVLLPVLPHRHLDNSPEWPGPVPSWMNVLLCFGSVLTLYVYFYGLCSLGSVGGGNPLYHPGGLPLPPGDLGTSCGDSAPATEPFPTCWQTLAWSFSNILRGWTCKGH